MLDCFKDLKPFEETDKDGNFLLDLIIDKRSKKKDYDLHATASFSALFVDGKGQVHFKHETHGACHGSFHSSRFRDYTGCRLVISNFQSTYRKLSSGKLKDVDKYVDYLVNRSMFKHAFIHYEPYEYWVVRGDLPNNYVTGALISTRACWEKFDGPIRSFNKLVDAGMDEHAAFVLCFVFFYWRDDALEAQPYSGHLPMHCDCLTTFKNYVKGNINTKLFTKNLNKTTAYYDIDNLWGVQRKDGKISDFLHEFTVKSDVKEGPNFNPWVEALEKYIQRSRKNTRKVFSVSFTELPKFVEWMNNKVSEWRKEK